MKYLLIVMSLGYCLIACNSTQTVLLNKWATNTIKIDGQLLEWEKPLQRPAKYVEIECAVANDKENLYICTRIPNKQLQQRIMGLGMTIWIDTLTKNKEKIGIGYPIALTNEQIEKISLEAQKNNRLDARVLDEAYGRICQEFELVGFVEERVRVSNLASRDMKVATAFDEVGAMICELKIPLSQLWNRSLQYNETMSVGVKINTPKQDASEDPGLFDDPNQNSITGNRQTQNPMGLPGQQPTMPQQRQMSTANNNIGIWLRTTLVKE